LLLIVAKRTLLEIFSKKSARHSAIFNCRSNKIATFTLAGVIALRFWGIVLKSNAAGYVRLHIELRTCLHEMENVTQE